MENKNFPLNRSRYIFDPLYGIIYLPDFIWDIISSPELQRLREVRLCNINSFTLTGGANINRYEHAIGTCYLALECIKSWPILNPIFDKEKRNLLSAALLHDITSSAFGHSVEYIESIDGFEHENAFEFIVLDEGDKKYRYQSSQFEPIFFGMTKEIRSKLDVTDIMEISKIISGKGKFGPLINSDIDLDNIDNVYRMAYHLGIVNSGEGPKMLAKSIYIDKGELVIRKSSIKYIEEWHNVRKKLYKLLLLNPEEFSAKYMLTESIDLSKIKQEIPFNWYDVDFELLKKFKLMSDVSTKTLKRYVGKIIVKTYTFFNNRDDYINLNKLFDDVEFNTLIENSKKYKYGNGIILNVNNKEYYIEYNRPNLMVYEIGIRGTRITELVSRIMRGDLYGCIGIYSSNNINKYDEFLNYETRNIIESKINIHLNNMNIPQIKNPICAVHPIIDVNKTERQIITKSDDGEIHTIGNRSSELLLGCFLKNKNFSLYKLNKIRKKTIKSLGEGFHLFLSEYLEDTNLKALTLYNERYEI